MCVLRGRKRSIFHLLSFIGLVIAALGLSDCSDEPVIGKWKNGLVKYYLTGEFTEQEVDLLENAMRKWEAAAGIRFEEVTPRSGVYQIIRVHEYKWQSSVGENNPQCQMIFGKSEDPLNHIVHELGHGIGFLHEHQRPDRDQYISVNWTNILDFYRGAFEKRDNPLITESNYAYDYGSVMHYQKTAFSKNGSFTIEPRDQSQQITRELISEIDAQKAREIYGDPYEE